MKAKSVYGLLFSILLLLAAGGAEKSLAQMTKDEKTIKTTGTVTGTIYIKNVSGNNLGNFGCGNMKVYVSSLGAASSYARWSHSKAASGDFSKRKCSFLIPNVPSGESFLVSVTAEFPKGCDQKVFKVDNSFPMTVKTGEKFVYNPNVTQITCTLLK